MLKVAPQYCETSKMSITSAVGVIALLDEPNVLLKEFALQKLNEIVDEFWPEIADSVEKIEILHEDKSFQQRELAALVVSKVYHHLGSFEDSLTYALGAGNLFDVMSNSEYVQTTIAKCMDFYSQQKVALAEGTQDVKPIDSRLEGIVNRMFQRCLDDGQYKQAIGIAIETRRMDVFRRAILESGDVPGMLHYCLKVCLELLQHRQFRNVVLRCLVDLYRELATPDYVSMCQCLIFLDDPLAVADILDKLVHGEQDSTLMAYQIAFDLYESATQQFLARVLQALKPTTVAPPVADEDKTEENKEVKVEPVLSPKDELMKKRLDRLVTILGGELSIELHLQFLIRNNKSDLLILKQTKDAIRVSVCHTATVIANAFMHSGTTSDQFLRDNLDWLSRATNWAKLTATASLGVIHRGHEKEALALMAAYLPREVAVVTPKESNSSAKEQNSSKRASVSELAVADNVNDVSEGATKSEYKEVPKHLSESNYPEGIVPSCPPIGLAAQANGEKNGVRLASKDAEKPHRDELQQITNQDGEEIVRIVVLPTPPQQKGKKGAKREKQENQGKPKDDGSSSSSSSSSEEEKTPRPNAVQQPLIFNIRRPELEIFRRRGVLPLKHISPKFPRAIFHCRLCSFHISSIPEVYRHTKDDRHVRLQKQEMNRQTASLMPFPTPEIADVIGQFVENIYKCSGLTPEDLKIRRAATEMLKNMIEMAFPGFTIRPYGSVVTELGLRASDVNVGLLEISPDSKKDGLIIIQVLAWLRGPASNTFRHIGDDLNCRTPVIHFQYEQMGITFAMVVESDNAYKTTLLLQQYRIIDPRFAVLTVAFRTFARICSLDQPELGSLPSHAFTLMVLYYLQQDRVLPVLHQLKKSDREDDYMTADEFLKMKENGEWKSKDLSLAHLWLGLLKFYAYTFTNNEHAVCVRTIEPLLRSTKNWGNRRIAIEDPFHGNVNMGAFMSTAQAFEFFIDCIRNIFHYFWVPQTANGPLFVHLLLPGEVNTDDPLQCTPAEAVRRMTALKKEDVKWDFQPEKILLSKRLPVICTICGADGHTKQKCTELEVPDVGFIPPPDFNYFALLDNVCWNIFRNFAQRDVDTANRKTIHKELESHIRGDYPDAVLSMFGSSCNGFGFADSDVDLCLTFESNEDGKGIDFVAVVKKLAKSLKRNRFFCDIVPISSAKVPIVKLRHRPTGLESDISLYNQLGRRNSQLLATYCAIDTRVRILGYMAKLLAKQCEIGDASRGSLSSYAYTLMVIHYLQQVTPPVIPVLQEIKFEGPDRKKYFVEGWDTWFFENTEDLGRVWPHLGANREPPSTLWLGFLLYYAKLFDYRLQVVSIRQLKPLFRLEKMWTDRPIAIEDPFDLSHNLGSGVSLRMGAYIRRVFVTARRFFQTPVRALPPHFSSLEEYLFNPKVLIATGPPPNDRGCLICGKVGHKAKECENRGRRNRGQDQNPPLPRDNPQNAAQEVHNRNVPQQTMNRDRGPQQMNRYRPQGFHQMNRDRVGGQQQHQQANRHRPVRPNHRPGMPQNSGEQIFTARRPTADPNQP